MLFRTSTFFWKPHSDIFDNVLPPPPTEEHSSLIAGTRGMMYKNYPLKLSPCTSSPTFTLVPYGCRDLEARSPFALRRVEFLVARLPYSRLLSSAQAFEVCCGGLHEGRRRHGGDSVERGGAHDGSRSGSTSAQVRVPHSLVPPIPPPL